MHKILPIAHVFSKLVMLFSCMFVFPVLVSLYYRDGTVDDFLVSTFVGLAIGLFLWATTRQYERELKPRDGFILVTLLWLGFSVDTLLLGSQNPDTRSGCPTCRPRPP